MEKKQNAPGTPREHAGACNTHCKDNNFPVKLSFHQKRVYDLLSNGGQYSAADISTALRMSDPRSVIRDLRVKGVNIADEWFKSEHGGRFKRYFIHGGNAGKEVRNE